MGTVAIDDYWRDLLLDLDVEFTEDVYVDVDLHASVHAFQAHPVVLISEDDFDMLNGHPEFGGSEITNGMDIFNDGPTPDDF